MLARGDCRGNFFLGQKSSQRQPGGNWFGDGNNVRNHAERLEGEDGAGAAETALNFVENQGGLVTIGERTAFLEKACRTFVNSAFAEDWFEDDGAGAVVHGSVQGSNIIARDKLYLFKQRLESLAVFVLPGERHGAESSSVVRTLKSHQLTLGLASCAMTCEPGEFDGSFDASVPLFEKKARFRPESRQSFSASRPWNSW